jgi:hypothetical protein
VLLLPWAGEGTEQGRSTRKRRPASIVPGKTHATQRGSTLEGKSPGHHIAGMSAKSNDRADPQQPAEKPADPPGDAPPRPREIGGPKGPEPTRYGDWEVNGRCTDF